MFQKEGTPTFVNKKSNMKKITIKTFLLSGIFISLFTSCQNNKDDKSNNDKSSNDKSINDIIGNHLSITPDNIEKVYKEFEVDYYTASQKYEKQEIYSIVTINCLSGMMESFKYKKQPINGFQVIETNPMVTVSPDMKIPDSLPHDFQLLSSGLGNDNMLYVVYDKKQDRILSPVEVEDVLNIKELMTSKDTSSYFLNVRRDKLNNIEYEMSLGQPKMLQDLKNGDLYYIGIQGRENDPQNGDYLISCKILIKGTVSIPIQKRTTMMGNIYDFKLINSELVKTEWLIDKKTTFTKQIVYNNLQNNTTPQTKENSPVSEKKDNDYKSLIGEYKGSFGPDKILLSLENINSDGSVNGFNEVKGNKRILTGKMKKNNNDYTFELKEPGDDTWDGVFNFTITDYVLSGNWKSNNGKSTYTYSLRK